MASQIQEITKHADAYSPVTTLTDSDLIDRAIIHACKGATRNKTTRAVVCEVFGIPAKDAFEICRNHGFDPAQVARGD